MTVGLYLLAGPLREDATTIERLAPVWIAFIAYEFLVIAAIAVLRRRGVPFHSLGIISCFFLADPIFLSNSFASIDPQAGLTLNLAAWAASLLKAATLARASGVKISPWLAGGVSGALGFIHLFPSLIAFPETLPVLPDAFWTGLWAASAIAVPLLWKLPKLGAFLVAAVGVHAAATGMVMSVEFELRYLTPPLLAAAIVLPWRRFSWIPATAAVACSPLRPAIRDFTPTQDGVGIVLVIAAFVLLGIGLLRSLARSRRPAPVRGDRPLPAAGGELPCSDSLDPSVPYI